jgi:hypothetical protein
MPCCNKQIHLKCLQNWYDTKLECPHCRAKTEIFCDFTFILSQLVDFDSSLIETLPYGSSYDEDKINLPKGWEYITFEYGEYDKTYEFHGISSTMIEMKNELIRFSVHKKKKRIIRNAKAKFIYWGEDNDILNILFEDIDSKTKIKERNKGTVNMNFQRIDT